jgi:hypothetical protein
LIVKRGKCWSAAKRPAPEGTGGCSNRRRKARASSPKPAFSRESGQTRSGVRYPPRYKIVTLFVSIFVTKEEGQFAKVYPARFGRQSTLENSSKLRLFQIGLFAWKILIRRWMLSWCHQTTAVQRPNTRSVILPVIVFVTKRDGDLLL